MRDKPANRTKARASFGRYRTATDRPLRNEEPVLDSDMAGFGIPKMEFEEIGEFLRAGKFRARP